MDPDHAVELTRIITRLASQRLLTARNRVLLLLSLQPESIPDLSLLGGIKNRRAIYDVVSTNLDPRLTVRYDFLSPARRTVGRDVQYHGVNLDGDAEVERLHAQIAALLPSGGPWSDPLVLGYLGSLVVGRGLLREARYWVLVALADGPASQAQLADRLSIARTTVGRALTSFEGAVEPVPATRTPRTKWRLSETGERRLRYEVGRVVKVVGSTNSRRQLVKLRDELCPSGVQGVRLDMYPYDDCGMADDDVAAIRQGRLTRTRTWDAYMEFCREGWAESDAKLEEETGGQVEVEIDYLREIIDATGDEPLDPERIAAIRLTAQRTMSALRSSVM